MICKSSKSSGFYIHFRYSISLYICAQLNYESNNDYKKSKLPVRTEAKLSERLFQNIFIMNTNGFYLRTLPAPQR